MYCDADRAQEGKDKRHGMILATKGINVLLYCQSVYPQTPRYHHNYLHRLKRYSTGCLFDYL